MSNDYDPTPEQLAQVEKNHASIERVTLIDASTVTPKAVQWLWKGWLACGKFHLIAGAPGTGKTTLALAFGSAISAGGKFPDGSRAELGLVVMWSGEDDIDDTLVPRKMLMEADLSNVRFVGGVSTAQRRRSFDLGQDVELLEKVMDELAAEEGKPPIRLLIVDPISVAVRGDGNKNGDVRRGLQPLVDLASRHRCALIGVTHLSKGTSGREPLERVTGSVAFGAFARVVMFASKQVSEEGEPPKPRILVRVKSNHGPESGGFKYDLEERQLPGYENIQSSCVSWMGVIEGEARDLLAQAEPPREGRASPVNEAVVAFLRELLKDFKPLPATTVLERAKERGFSPQQLDRAKAWAKVANGKAMFKSNKTPENTYEWVLLF